MAGDYGPSEPAPATFEEHASGSGFRRYLCRVAVVDVAAAFAIIAAAIARGAGSAHEWAALSGLTALALIVVGVFIGGGGAALGTGSAGPSRYAPTGCLPNLTLAPRDPWTTIIAGILIGAAMLPLALAVARFALG